MNMNDMNIRVRHIAWFEFGVELPVPFSPLTFCFVVLLFSFLFPVVFFTFEDLFVKLQVPFLV